MTQRFSLTTRLTLFYTLASATVLLGLGWVTSMAMNQHFEDLDRSLLEDKIHLIQEVATKANSPQDLQNRLNEVLHSHEGLIVNVQISGKTLYETAKFEIPDGYASQVGRDLKSQKMQSWQSAGHQYRALGMLINSELQSGVLSPNRRKFQTPIRHRYCKVLIYIFGLCTKSGGIGSGRILVPILGG